MAIRHLHPAGSQDRLSCFPGCPCWISSSWKTGVQRACSGKSPARPGCLQKRRCRLVWEGERSDHVANDSWTKSARMSPFAFRGAACLCKGPAVVNDVLSAQGNRLVTSCKPGFYENTFTGKNVALERSEGLGRGLIQALLCHPGFIVPLFLFSLTKDRTFFFFSLNFLIRNE